MAIEKAKTSKHLHLQTCFLAQIFQQSAQRRKASNQHNCPSRVLQGLVSPLEENKEALLKFSLQFSSLSQARSLSSSIVSQVLIVKFYCPSSLISQVLHLSSFIIKFFHKSSVMGEKSSSRYRPVPQAKTLQGPSSSGLSGYPLSQVLSFCLKYRLSRSLSSFFSLKIYRQVPSLKFYRSSQARQAFSRVSTQHKMEF